MTRTKFSENSIYSQVLSFEVLDYFNSIATEENYNWIEKYFDVLMKNDNVMAEKYNIHHIRPCCTFKDDKHKTRKETEKSANEFNGNTIKLSIYNHLFAHYYLWKIFNNKDLKRAFQSMCGESNYIDVLTENELIEIARLKEECTKKNQTEKEKKEYKKSYGKKWRKEHPNYNKTEKAKEYKRKWSLDNKDRLKEKSKNKPKTEEEKLAKRLYYKKYYQTHKNDENYKKSKKRQKSKESSKIKAREYSRNYRKTHKQERREYEINNRDKINERKRKYRRENREELLEKRRNYERQMCFDPIAQNECSVRALRGRKHNHKELYKDVIIKNCIIQTSVPST